MDGRSLPFAVVNKADGKIIGTTRYCNIDSANRRLEIGHTWYAKSFQRTGVNTECKYLLLRHAFEELEAIAVEFRTNWFNHRSRNAILRLGAKQDGVYKKPPYRSAWIAARYGGIFDYPIGVGDREKVAGIRNE